MAKQNLGKIIMTPKGVYNNSTTYEFLDVVTYNGSSYVCKQATTGNLPTTDYWQQLAYKGDKPVVGVDYFTEDDKKEIADSVIEISNEDIDDLYNALLSNTVTGTDDININDAVKCRCIETKVNGMSVQDGEPSPTTPVEIVSLGYENLFKVPTTQTKNGVTLTNNGDGTFNIIGTATANTTFYIEIPLKESKINSGVYTISCKSKGYTAQVDLYNTTWLATPIYRGHSEDKFNSTMEINITSNVEKIRCIIYLPLEKTINLTNETVQLNKGSIPHAYIPYGKYGVGVKTVGKNLFNKDTVASGYRLGSDGTPFSASDYWLSDFIKVDPSSEYVYQRVSKNDSQAYAFYDENKNFISRTFMSNSSVIYITTTNTTKYIRITDLNDSLNVAQLEEGTVATDFVPYQENISVIPLNEPLRSLPNGVKDRAYLKNNKLYVDRYVTNMILNGSENWAKSTRTDVNRYYVNGLLNTTSNRTDVKSICSHFKSISQNQSDEALLGITTMNTDGIMVNIDVNDTNFDTLEKFKTMLSNYPMLFNYELATPVTEYLGTLEDLPRTFEGGCNITADSNMDNIELEVKYAQDIKAYINNLIK